MTGLDLGRTPARWQAWWRAEGATFELPSYEDALLAEQARNRNHDRGGTRSSFYGLEIVSKRVCFILDISGSMMGARIEAAKGELTAALERYPEGDLFNIIFYSTDVFPWRDKLVEMTKRNRTGSLEYVGRQTAAGGTAIYDALEAAFDDPLIDTIYLLSDGIPSAGKIVDPAGIRQEVARWNTARKVRIHTISLGGQGAKLLRWLSKDSGGRFKVVR